MANNIATVSDFSIKSSDVFFFDNNIWMYIFCPLANYKKDREQRIYSKFFQQLLCRKLHIYTTTMVLSEFSNRYLRLDYDLIRKDPANAGKYNNYKKDYVGSARFKETAKEVKHSIHQITKICQKSSDEFTSINFDEVLKLFTTIGFNDSYYLHQAAKKNWIIVTDDSDFTNNSLPDLKLTILTSKIK